MNLGYLSGIFGRKYLSENLWKEIVCLAMRAILWQKVSFSYSKWEKVSFANWILDILHVFEISFIVEIALIII